MKKSLNGTALEPSIIIDRETTKSKKFDSVFDWIKSNVIEKHNILKDKELLLMSSISIIWFLAFFYFLLFVFT